MRARESKAKDREGRRRREARIRRVKGAEEWSDWCTRTLHLGSKGMSVAQLRLLFRFSFWSLRLSVECCVGRGRVSVRIKDPSRRATRSRVLVAGSRNASDSVLGSFAALFMQVDRTVSVISGASTRDISTVFLRSATS